MNRSNEAEYLCPDHSAHVSRIERSEKDIQEVWSVINTIREEAKKLSNKMAWLFGMLTAANAVVMLVMQYIFSRP